MRSRHAGSTAADPRIAACDEMHLELCAPPPRTVFLDGQSAQG